MIRLGKDACRNWMPRFAVNGLRRMASGASQRGEASRSNGLIRSTGDPVFLRLEKSFGAIVGQIDPSRSPGLAARCASLGPQPPYSKWNSNEAFPLRQSIESSGRWVLGTLPGSLLPGDRF